MISDEECIDTMRYDIMQGLKDKEKMPNTTYEDLLNSFEIDLFEEYAPKLFNTYSKPKELKKAMIRLIELYIFYENNKPRYEKDVLSINQVEQIVYKRSPIPSKNKKYEEQIEAFKNHIIAMCKFMGGKSYGTEKGKILKEQLQKVYDNADKYIPKTPIITISKKPIKDYLLSLKLEGKSKEISNFIKAIK